MVFWMNRVDSKDLAKWSHVDRRCGVRHRDARLVGVNMTRAPMQLARTFVGIVEERTGWDVELRGARLAGDDQASRLTHVVIRSDDADLKGSLPIVDIPFNPIQLLTRRGADPNICSVHLIRPRIGMGAIDTEPRLTVMLVRSPRPRQPA